MKNYLISGMYTTRKNIFKNEQNSNSNHKTNGSPRWGGGGGEYIFKLLKNI